MTIASLAAFFIFFLLSYLHTILIVSSFMGFNLVLQTDASIGIPLCHH
uniref:Uncharacterized protein n=1 Tax=Arundo donax TaxID=35708 RepID=A0A0A9HI53_ARUDO